MNRADDLLCKSGLGYVAPSEGISWIDVLGGGILHHEA